MFNTQMLFAKKDITFALHLERRNSAILKRRGENYWIDIWGAFDILYGLNFWH